MRRTLTVLLLFAASMLLLTASVVSAAPAAQSGSAATTDNVNLRATPSTSAEILAKLPFGATVTLLGRDNVGGWVRVRTADGKTGWLAARFLSITPGALMNLPVTTAGGSGSGSGQPAASPAEVAAPAPAAAPAGGVRATTTATVNVRSGPGTTSERIARVNFNTELRVQGRNDKGDWVRAALPDGSVGWISAAYVSLPAAQISALPVVSGGGAAALAAPAAPAAPIGPITNTAPVTGFAVGGHISGFGGTAVAAMQRAGMTWVKKQIRYGGDGGGSGAISEAHSKGFRVLLGVVGSPSAVNEPGYFERFASYLGSLAAAGADAIEVWNEQNIDREWATGSIDPARYTEMLKLAYNAIKAANPNTLVISGAPAPTGFFGGCTANGCDDNVYIAGMAAAGAAQYMDCVGVHYNEGIVPPSATSGDPRGNSGHYSRYFFGMVNTYYNAFGGAKPLCFTELGYLSPEGFGGLPDAFAWAGNVTVAQQASWLAEAVALGRNSGKVRLIIIWNVDFSNFGSDPMAGYAMIRPDGSCPACDALAR